MWVTFEGMVLARTARGILFQGTYWDAPLWFPSSQTLDNPDGVFTCVFRVKKWLADRKGLLEFTHYSEDAIKEIAGI